MKRKYPFALGSIAIIGAVLILAVMQASSVHSGPQTSTPTPPLEGYKTTQFNQNAGTVLPVMPTVAPQKFTDLSPELSFDKKVAVIVRHADGTRERYDIARSMLYAFIKKLPREDTLIRISPIEPASGGYAMPTFVEMSPTPKVTDLLPNIDDSEKATLVVRHADGSEEIFLIAPDRIDLFIHILPTEDKVIQVISPRATECTPEP